MSEDQDIFALWKAEVADLRRQHEAEIVHLKAKHKKQLAKQTDDRWGDWRNWRGR